MTFEEMAEDNSIHVLSLVGIVYILLEKENREGMARLYTGNLRRGEILRTSFYLRGLVWLSI